MDPDYPTNGLESVNDEQVRCSKRRRGNKAKFEELRLKLDPNDRFKVKLPEFRSKASWVRKFSGNLIDTKGVTVSNHLFCFVCYIAVREDSEFILIEQLERVTFLEGETAITNMASHLISKHRFLKENQLYNQNLLSSLQTRTSCPSTKQSTVTHRQFDFMLTTVVVGCHLSICLVDNPIFRNFLSAIAPNYLIPSRQSLASTHLPDVYTLYYLKVCELISQTAFRTLFLCCDIWLCKPKQVSFICFNAHFYSEKENKVLKATLKFQELETPHNHEHISELISNLFKEFSINEKRIR